MGGTRKSRQNVVLNIVILNLVQPFRRGGVSSVDLGEVSWRGAESLAQGFPALRLEPQAKWPKPGEAGGENELDGVSG